MCCNVIAEVKFTLKLPDTGRGPALFFGSGLTLLDVCVAARMLSTTVYQYLTPAVRPAGTSSTV